MALLVVAVATPGAVETRTLTVAANSPNWLDTGLSLSAGASATLAATGDGTCHAGGASDCPVGNPNGVGFTCASNPIVGSVPPGPAGPNVPYGALAGKVGTSGTPFLVGAGKTVGGSGELFLVYNDCDPPSGYSDNAGTFTVKVTGDFGKPAPPAPVAKVVEIRGPRGFGAHVRRGGTGPLRSLFPGAMVGVGDVISTDGNTVMALEFGIGGRLGINKNSEITITGERSVSNNSPDKFTLSKGGMWGKVGDLKADLEIQTNGGVIGIKG
jgi:hypothetical protein